MKKRILSLLLAALMIVSLLPTMAFATDNIIQVNGTNCGETTINTTKGSMAVTLVDNTVILTLTDNGDGDFEYTGAGIAALDSATGGLKIVAASGLKTAKFNINTTSGKNTGYALRANKGDVVIDLPDVDVTVVNGENATPSSDTKYGTFWSILGSINLKAKSLDITAQKNSVLRAGNGSITLNSVENTTLTCNDSSVDHSIYGSNISVTSSEGAVAITAAKNAIYSGNTVTLKAYGDVSVGVTDGFGIYCNTGNVSVSGKNLTLKGTGASIYAKTGDVTVQNTAVDGKLTEAGGIHANGTAIIASGDTKYASERFEANVVATTTKLMNFLLVDGAYCCTDTVTTDQGSMAIELKDNAVVLTLSGDEFAYKGTGIVALNPATAGLKIVGDENLKKATFTANTDDGENTGYVLRANKGDLTIDLSDADVEVTCGDKANTGANTYAAIWSLVGSVNVTAGSLKVNSAKTSAIHAGSGAVTIESEADTTGNIEIFGGQGDTCYHAVIATGDIKITSKEDLTVKSNYYGLLSTGGDIELTAENVTFPGSATATASSDTVGIVCSTGNVSIKSAGKVEIGSEYMGVHCAEGDVTVESNGAFSANSEILNKKEGTTVTYLAGSNTSLADCISLSKNESYLIKLAGDHALNAPLEIPEGKTITIDLNGYSISRTLEAPTDAGNVITVKGDLTIKDTSKDKDGKITGGNSNFGGAGVRIEKTGSFTQEAGLITDNHSQTAGGGVLALGSYTMNGGAVTNNTAVTAGGGVYVQNTMTLTDGEISGNKAVSGAGVYVYALADTSHTVAYHFTMTGGKIKNNIASDKGGGIYADNYDIDVLLLGGEITGNTSVGIGGGVCCNMPVTVGGTVKITGNTSGAVDSKVASNVYLRTTGKSDYSPVVNISTDTAIADGASLGISSDTTAPVAISGTCTDVSEFFTADHADEQVIYENGVLKLVAKIDGDCEYSKSVKLTEGTFGMKLGGKDAGWFKFEAVDGGWSIYNGEKFLAMKDGKLTLSDTAFAWTYKNGAFSTTVKTTQKTSGHWILFIYVPGSTKTVTTTYYLSTVTDGHNLSNCLTCAELYENASVAAHDFGDWIDCKDGVNHKHVCKNCGEVETEAHKYDETTHKCVCGAYDPTKTNVKISVDVKEKTTKQYSGFLFWGTWKNVTTYTATIKTEATGVKVTKVQYQLNGGRWTTGTSVSSNKPIETLKVKAWDNKGNVYEYEYPEAPAPTTYIVTFNSDGSGEVQDSNGQKVTQTTVPSGAEISVNNNQITIGENTFTAVVTGEGYVFYGFSQSSGTITGATTITVNFSENQP